MPDGLTACAARKARWVNHAVDSPPRTESMTAQDMIGWTSDGNGIREKPADAALDVTIDDAYREIASVTVHNAIYREYLHLVRTLHGWKILSALYMRVRE
jgi:hypothetical protein